MIRLATWNICSGRSMTDGSMSASALSDAAASFDADVLAVQELDRGQERSGPVDQAALVAGGRPFVFAPVLAGTPGSRWTDAEPDSPDPVFGIALVTRLPIVSSAVVRLAAAPVRFPLPIPDGRGRVRAVCLPDEPRRAVVAVLEGPRGPFTVAATHLSFLPGWNARQVRLLLPHLVRSPGPRFLLGDLNLPAPLPRLLAPGWQPLASTRTWPVQRLTWQLDHVLAHGFTGQVSAARTLDAGVSDHRALLVDVHL